jgi:hypothetical protein
MNYEPMNLKVTTWGILIGSLKTICHFDATPMIGHKLYYRNGGGGICPSLGHGVFYEFGSFMYHFGLNLP